MGETRVDLLHLLEDLRDAYPGPPEETILAEIVANALDSGAATIALTADAALPALTIVDDGSGMRRRELAKYHDVATTTKPRGAGIGFAGVGIKIALLVCDEVLTETRRGRHHIATLWGLSSRHRAPWRWVPPPGLVARHGTAVRLRPSSALSPLIDPGFIEAAVRRHFHPLLDPAFGEILSAHYRHPVRFLLNGDGLDAQSWSAGETAALAIRLPRRRKPAGSGYIVRDDHPLPEERRGIAISTFGKVIKRGWDWLGLTPAASDRVGGLIEVPALAECLALNKADFLRAGTRGAIYLAYRKAIQEAVSHQLSMWGDSLDTGERARRRAARPVERDLETVLIELADDFPLLASLVERRAGGQRRLSIGTPAREIEPDGGPLFTVPEAGAGGGDGAPPVESEPRAAATDAAPDVAPAATVPPEDRGPRAPEVQVASQTGTRRPARYGLSIQFEQRPDDPELGRLVESTVWVNEAHPAYRRAVASRSEGYHLALTTAMTLAPLAVEPAKEHAFVTAFLTAWGAALERGRRRRRG